MTTVIKQSITDTIAKYDNGGGVLEIPRKELENLFTKIIKKTINKKVKKIKDPNAPKKSTTAYFFFLGEKREEIKNTLGDEEIGVKSKLVAKKAGEMWNGLSEDERKPYIELSTKDKERYLVDLEKYSPHIETGYEFQEAPENWKGPYKLRYLSKYPSRNGKILGKELRTFEDFSEAIKKAEELGDICGGITLTSSGYTLRDGCVLKNQGLSNSHLGICSWVKSIPEPEPEKKIVVRRSKRNKKTSN